MNASGAAWGTGIASALAVSWVAHALPLALNVLLTVAFIVLAIPLAVPSLRRKLISDGVLRAFRKVMPPMSQTEREALEAGTVWWDGELFSGRPDWRKLLATPTPDAHAGGAALPRRGNRSAVRDDQRLGDDQRLQGPAAARVAVHQGQGLLRHDHPARSTAASASPRTRIRR